MSAIKKIVFVCNAGMASGALGAARLRQKLRVAGLASVVVIHVALDEIPADADIIVAHRSLGDRAARPGISLIVISDFLNAPEYEYLLCPNVGLSPRRY